MGRAIRMMGITSGRPLAKHEIVFGLIIVAALAYFAYEWASLVQGNAGLTAPPTQPQPDDMEAEARVGWFRARDGHSVICHPEQHHAGYVYTPHRYPRGMGGNVTNVIHRGWATMRIPNTDDVQWMISPPSEEAW